MIRPALQVLCKEHCVRLDQLSGHMIVDARLANKLPCSQSPQQGEFFEVEIGTRTLLTSAEEMVMFGGGPTGCGGGAGAGGVGGC